MPEMIVGTAGAVPNRPGDATKPSPRTARPSPTPSPFTVPGAAARGATTVPGATAVPPGTVPGAATPGPTGTAPVPAGSPERRPGEDSTGDAGRGLSPAGPSPVDPGPAAPRHRAEGEDSTGDDPADRPDPVWLRWSINAAFGLLSVAALLLSADGQIQAAARAQVPYLLRPFAPGVLELVGVLLMLLGYRRGRRGGSPAGYWSLAAGVGAYAIFLTTSKAPTLGAALLFGGASGALLLISFLKFREDLLRYQRDVLGRRPKQPPTFGGLWLTNHRLAWRALLVAIEFDLTTIKQAKSAARTWIAVYDDAVDFYQGTGLHLVLPPSPAVPAAAKPRQARRDALAARGQADARGRYLAHRTADAAVAGLLGQPFHIPEVAQAAVVAMHQRPAPVLPGDAGTSLPASQPAITVPGDGPGDTAPNTRQLDPGTRAEDTAAIPGDSPDRPEAGPGTSRDVPAPSGLTVADMRAMIPADLVALAAKQAPSWDWAALLGQLDEKLPGWLHRPSHPVRDDVAKPFELGNTRGSLLRRMVEAIRTTHAESLAMIAAATRTTADVDDADVGA